MTICPPLTDVKYIVLLFTACFLISKIVNFMNIFLCFPLFVAYVCVYILCEILLIVMSSSSINVE